VTPTLIEARPLLRTGCRLGEGPRWSRHHAELAWVDIEGRAFWRWDGSGAPTRLDVLGEPTCVFETDCGDYLLAIDAGVCPLADCRLPAAERTPVWSLPGIEPAVARSNDGRVDTAGRIWLGTMARDLVTPSAVLCRDDEVVLRGLTISNGIGWSPADDTLYLVDTPTGTISRFAYEPASGTIGARSTFATVAAPAGSPDGLAVDAEGGVWVALWGGGAVHRYDAAGRHTHTITVPGATNVTAPAFGGDDLTELYLTTASSADDPHGGDLFVAAAPHPGLPENLLRTKGSTS
jgi:sugar lactone lactonase YvrE